MSKYTGNGHTARSPADLQAAKRAWRRLPPHVLAATILQMQRSATRQHLSEQEWRRLDRMRRRYQALQKELAATEGRTP